MTATATATPDPETLAGALALFQADLPRVGKDNTGNIPGKDGKQGYKYDYADLADVTRVALPLLGKFGLSWSTKPTVLEGVGFVLEYRLRHRGGEEDIGAYPLPDPNRTPAQQVGSAITYARRYALCSVTGIAPDGDDDDGAAAQRGRDARPPQTRSSGSSGAQRPANGAASSAAKPATASKPAAAGDAAAAAKPDRSANTKDAVHYLLAANTEARAEQVVAKVAENGDGALDATAYLADEDREVLGDRLDDTVTLDDLCAAVLGYWSTHGTGPRFVRELVDA